MKGPKWLDVREREMEDCYDGYQVETYIQSLAFFKYRFDTEPVLSPGASLPSPVDLSSCWLFFE